VHCPFCRHADSRVIDSRTSDDGLSIRRRRQCPQCGGRFTTVETASLNVIKRSGVIEPFSREKVMSGVRKACQGRPVTEGDLAMLAQAVEEAVRQTGASQIDTNEIGLTILGRCVNSTRWPICASRACTRRSTRWRTSRRRSRSCVPTTRGGAE
jgi:transcriptional repressor NrdR